MPHEVTNDELSAFLDNELDAGSRTLVERHLASCRDCAALLERLKKASLAFRDHGLASSPARLASRALEAARGSGERRVPAGRLRFAFALAVVVIVVLAGGVAFKRFMPQFFEQIQGMIGKAAGSLGR